MSVGNERRSRTSSKSSMSKLRGRSVFGSRPRQCAGPGGIGMSQALEEAVASCLWDASVSKVPCRPVRDDIGKDNMLGAYRIQYTNAKRRIASGAAHVGFKVGMTSTAVQQQLGYFEPNFGHLFGDCEFLHGD